MDQTEGDLKRALRTVKRSLETVETVDISPEEATKVLFSAVYQLLFLVEKLVDERSSGQSGKSKAGNRISMLSQATADQDRERESIGTLTCAD
jgi:hypothetical protein